MLAKLGGAGTRGRVDEIEVNDFLEDVLGVNGALVDTAVVLPRLVPAAQTCLLEGILKTNVQVRARSFELFLHLFENRPESVGRENLVGEKIKHAHYPRHIYALAVGGKRYRCGNRRLQRAYGAVAAQKLQRQLEVVHSHLGDCDVCALNRVFVGILGVGQRQFVVAAYFEVFVVKWGGRSAVVGGRALLCFCLVHREKLNRR